MHTICDRPWNRLVSIALFAALFVPDSFATHFRFGHFSWEPTTNPGEVRFQLVNAFRRSGYTGSAPDGLPRIGDIITETVGATAFLFGDGQSTATLQYRVIAFSEPENWIAVEAL